MTLCKVRHRLDNGFTLVEMLVVLLMIAAVLVLFPLMHPRTQTMTLQMETLKQKLLCIQEEAQSTKQMHQITFDGNGFYDNGHYFRLSMSCSGELRFHPNGNVDHARTIVCEGQGDTGRLVILLGSGRMYVKK